MRVKTDGKRLQILEAAADQFLEGGFERTQLSDIAKVAGCSKGTIYSYFSSKEDLYYEVVMHASAQEANSVVKHLNSVSQSFDDTIYSFGEAFLRVAYSPSFQAIRRLVFSPASKHVARTIYEKSYRPYLDKTAAFLSQGMTSGELIKGDANVAANHLFGLLESELLMKFLLQALEPSDIKHIRNASRRAVDAFLAAYRS